MRKPTPAQIRYLKNARAVRRAGAGTGNFFKLRGPDRLGRTGTGSICETRGWIKQHSGGVPFYSITMAGIRILNAIERGGG